MVDSQEEVNNFDIGEVKRGGCISKNCNDTYLICHVTYYAR